MTGANGYRSRSSHNVTTETDETRHYGIVFGLQFQMMNDRWGV